jgi:hypothetical protein
MAGSALRRLMAEYKRKFCNVCKVFGLETNVKRGTGFHVFLLCLTTLLYKLKCICSLEHDWHIGTRMILSRPDNNVCIHKSDEYKINFRARLGACSATLLVDSKRSNDRIQLLQSS